MSWSYNTGGNHAGQTNNPLLFHVGGISNHTTIFYTLISPTIRTGGAISLSGDSWTQDMTQYYTINQFGTYYMESWYCTNVPAKSNIWIRIPNSGSVQLAGIYDKFSSTNDSMYVSQTGNTVSSTSISNSLSVNYNNMLFYNPIGVVNSNPTPNKFKGSVDVSNDGVHYIFAQISTSETYLSTATLSWTWSPSAGATSHIISLNDGLLNVLKVIYDPTNSNRIEFETGSPFKIFMTS